MDTYRTGRAVILSVLFLILTQTGVALAQETAQTTPLQRRVVAWTNPILFVFGWYMAEAEIRLKDNHTVGIAGSYLQFDTGNPGDIDYEDTEYFSINAFYRYYPTASFKGFFIGGQFGNVQVNQKEATDSNTFPPTTTGVTESSGSAMSVGVLIGYGWVLGDAQRIAVSLGIGANRLFGGDVDEDVNLTIPVVRLINVGIAF